MSEQYPKKIAKVTGISFSVSDDGFYSIAITARCQSGKQIDLGGGEDLRVEIDGLKFREIPPAAKPQYQDIPPSWNGSHLKGLSKTVTLLLSLRKGSHTLVFVPQHGAVLEHEPRVERIENVHRIVFDLNTQAEDGNRRPWHTFVLVDLPLMSLEADITTKWRFRDSDNVKVVIDNVIKGNGSSIFHRNWVWSGTLLKRFSSKEREVKNFEENLEEGIHYLEFWADRMPTLHKVVLDLGDVEAKRTPTADDPRWTGDFKEDTDQMILARAIFGEARSTLLSDKARFGVGWSIRNRVEDRRWPDTYQEVIIQPSQYSAFDERDQKNRPYVENPFVADNQIDRDAWFHCYEMAGEIIEDKVSDPTDGSNHYYDDSIEPPYWAGEKTFVVKIDTIFFHKL